MTQIFDAGGSLIPVTVIEAGPCTVVQKKTDDTDGYNALQLGFGEKRVKLVNKPEKGHFDKAGVSPKRHVRELRLRGDEELASLNVGDSVSVDVFAAGEIVDVTGISRGKGFQGSIKRHGFSRGPMTHGSHYHRSPGSLNSVDPARVFKGRRLPGRMGGKRRTVLSLEVIKVDSERNLLLIKGAVPGAKGSFVEVRESVRAQAK